MFNILQAGANAEDAVWWKKCRNRSQAAYGRLFK